MLSNGWAKPLASCSVRTSEPGSKATAHLILFSVALLVSSCATDQNQWLVPRRVNALLHKRDWPRVQSVARGEIERRKGDADSRDAFYRPIEHTNGVWFITVSGVMPHRNHYASVINGSGARGGYPRSMSWDAYDLRISDNGEALSYTSRRETQYDAGWVYP